jgi:aspartyl-tRNA(Asn)/glutamyl-tRNA(Gln) amidotransferase subunit B
MHISPITLGYPGTLPVLNKKAVEYAVRMGISCHCSIEGMNYFARKHYFYPDLPKGFQLSQHTTPICKGGIVRIRTEQGYKDILLNRIHLEEDAGKSIHDQDDEKTCIDYNRAGVPLIEIVSEPVITSGDEAYAYLTELRRLMRYLGICDGNMEEGSMRCDANISVRRKGDSRLGTKVEIKNLNSIRNVKRAIEFEAGRLMNLLAEDKRIEQQTRSFDAATGTSFALRTKEEANDYRYFADPDLPPFEITASFLKEISDALPELPAEKIERYVSVLGLADYDARVIADDRETADYFDALVLCSPHPKAAANWMMGPIRALINQGTDITHFPVAPERLAELVSLVEEGKLSFSMASSRILPELIKSQEEKPLQTAIRMNLLQDADSTELTRWVQEALARMPDKVAEYRKGKKGLIGLFVGEVKKISKGKADLKRINELLLEQLEN